MDQNTYYAVILLSCLQRNLPNSISRFFHYAMHCYALTVDSYVLTVGEFTDYHAPQIQSYSLLLIRKINKHDYKVVFYFIIYISSKHKNAFNKNIILCRNLTSHFVQLYSFYFTFLPTICHSLNMKFKSLNLDIVMNHKLWTIFSMKTRRKYCTLLPYNCDYMTYISFTEEKIDKKYHWSIVSINFKFIEQLWMLKTCSSSLDPCELSVMVKRRTICHR